MGDQRRNHRSGRTECVGESRGNEDLHTEIARPAESPVEGNCALAIAHVGCPRAQHPRPIEGIVSRDPAAGCEFVELQRPYAADPLPDIEEQLEWKQTVANDAKCRSRDQNRAQLAEKFRAIARQFLHSLARASEPRAKIRERDCASRSLPRYSRAHSGCQ